MFNNLSTKLTQTVRNLVGKGRLTEENIKDTLHEIKVALLDADVALTVANQFLADIKTKALGVEVMQKFGGPSCR